MNWRKKTPLHIKVGLFNSHRENPPVCSGEPKLVPAKEITVAAKRSRQRELRRGEDIHMSAMNG